MILERGEEYWEDGAVENLQRTPDGWEAIVNGSEEYSVEICTDGEDIEDMYCTCPYADSGRNCKHMAAVLFAVPEYIDEPEDGESVQDILQSMNEEELRKELQELMRKDIRTKERITAAYRTRPAQESDLIRFEKILDRIAKEYTDDYGCVSWDTCEDFCEALTDTIAEVIEPMIRRRETLIAFHAVQSVFRLMEDVITDAPCDEVFDAMEDAWTRIIEQAEETDRSVMYSWFSSMRSKADDLSGGYIIESVFYRSFQDDNHLELLLKETLNSLNNPDEIRIYGTSLLKKYRDILKRMGRPLDPYEKWMENHKDLEPVLSLRLEEAEERNDTGTALELLKKLYDYSEHIWDQRTYARRLLHKYEELQDPYGQKEWLHCLFRLKEISPAELQSLRSLCIPSEWTAYRESYIADHPDRTPQILAEEGLYDRLADILPQFPIETVNVYRSLLQKNHSDCLVNIYAGHIKKLESRHPCKSLYAEMKNYLVILAEIPGGMTAVSSFLRTWQIKYPTRAAMQAMISETCKSLSAFSPTDGHMEFFPVSEERASL